MKAEEYQSRVETIDGWPVRVTSYAIAGVHHCHIDNVSPGAIIARASDADRAVAEETARAKALSRLGSTVRRKIAGE